MLELRKLSHEIVNKGLLPQKCALGHKAIVFHVTMAYSESLRRIRNDPNYPRTPCLLLSEC